MMGEGLLLFHSSDSVNQRTVQCQGMESMASVCHFPLLYTTQNHDVQSQHPRVQILAVILVVFAEIHSIPELSMHAVNGNGNLIPIHHRQSLEYDSDPLISEVPSLRYPHDLQWTLLTTQWMEPHF